MLYELRIPIEMAPQAAIRVKLRWQQLELMDERQLLDTWQADVTPRPWGSNDKNGVIVGNQT